MNDEMNDKCNIIGKYALKSLLFEVSATPKPGLVDRNDNGAHSDMDFFSFLSSSAALAPYFIECARAGAGFEGEDLCELFRRLRHLGMAAEKDMLVATGNVNTQKGLIFSLGIICAASALCWKGTGTANLDTDEICERISLMTRGICERELGSSKKTINLTNGEKVFKKYGVKGVRGEAEAGFPTVRKHALPVMESLCREESICRDGILPFNSILAQTCKTRELSLQHKPQEPSPRYRDGVLPFNDILVQTLLHIMAVNEDTNILARHGMETLNYVRKYAARILDLGGMLTEQGRKGIHEMNRVFIEKNISPGGSADLLAVTIMFYLLSHHI
jgi:triphosphoribosyl-dephospho-CoA synthase